MSSEPSIVNIFTDGACSGNPGPGGWAALLRWRDKEKILTGKEKHTTNNRMELMAAIIALESLKKPVNVHLHTDSRYLHDGITVWIFQWKRQDWKNKNKKPVLNIDLWKRLDSACEPHEIQWDWVRGHDGHSENERVDKLARKESSTS